MNQLDRMGLWEVVFEFVKILTMSHYFFESLYNGNKTRAKLL